jgi:hypothetical protein
MLPTAVTYAQPRLALNTERNWSNFDPVKYSREFDWTSDPLSGYFDVVQPVEETLETKHGDCDDYAAAIASYLVSETTQPVAMTFLWRGRIPLPDHVVTHVPGRVYSSGVIIEDDIDTYIEESPYDHSFTRRIQ